MMDDVTLLAGVPSPEDTPWPPFDPRVLDFLSHLSEELLRQPETRSGEAAAGFAFWCRRRRLEGLAQRYVSPLHRLGQGLIFHLAPSNVPAMFAYTLALGLLAGNANIVRLSSRRAGEEEALLAVLNSVLDRPEHLAVKGRTALIRYDRNPEITARFCARCDGRVVWGGDETVAAVRAMPMPAHGVELCFPDRWSLALFSRAALSAMGPAQMAELAHRFYNDTYQMDQNACSSPQLVLWLNDGGSPDCVQRWWNAVAAEAARNYAFGPFQAACKLERLCLTVMDLPLGTVERVERFDGNLLCVADLAQLPQPLEQLKGGFGLFYQGVIQSLEELLSLLTPKVQTLVCGGVSPQEVSAWLMKRRAKGIYRVVLPGQALELDTLWDGKDVIGSLSRIIMSAE